ncbi:hypothetical protein GGI42DRAFT_53743 [Trichoderma sp. SZMC 28013]
MPSPFESIFRGIVDAPPAVPCCIVSLPHQLWGDSCRETSPHSCIHLRQIVLRIKGEASRVWICTGSEAHQHQHQAATWTLHDCPIAKASGLACVFTGICMGRTISWPYAKPFVLIRRGLTHHMALISGICLQASHPWGDGTYSLSGVDAPLDAWHPGEIMPKQPHSGAADWAAFLISRLSTPRLWGAGLSVVRLCLMAVQL